jgi:plastocyanin
MHRAFPVFPAAVLSLAALLATVALAGERRIDLAGTSFLPGSIPINQGDHVVWVWDGGNHDVTSGAGGAADGIFGSATMGSINDAFSWKADRTGTLDYFCSVHFGFGMFATLTIDAPGSHNVSNFRITEVQYNEATNKDRIEITNLGGDSGDLGRYRISVNGGSVAVPLNSQFVAVNGRVTIHTNETGTNTATNIFIPAIGDLPNTGSIGLYVPSTDPATSALTNTNHIIDFVQWGAGSQANEATAEAAGVWPTNEFMAGQPVGYSLVFCGTVSQYGKSFWNVARPNFGSQPLCATPVKASSWGRIKSLYR